MISRDFVSNFKRRLHKGKVIVLNGSRQVGKTTLIKWLLDKTSYLILDGDDNSVVETLSNDNTETMKSIICSYKYFFY